MPKAFLPLDDYIGEINRRLRTHQKFRKGMGVVKDPSAAAIGGYSAYTFTWPKRDLDGVQAWFDARDAIFDIELELRDIYALESAAEWAEPAPRAEQPRA